MNIIFLNDHAHVSGGTSQTAITEMKALVRAGHRVFLFSCTPPIDPTLEQAGIRVLCMEQDEILLEKNRLFAGIRGIWNVAACKKLQEFLKNFDPKEAIVHIHGWTKALSPAAIHTVLKMGFKTALTLHDYFIACPNGGFMDYPATKICKLKPLSLSCVLKNCDARCYLHKVWRVGRAFLQNSFFKIPQRIHQYIAVSEFSANILRPHLPQNANIYVLTNPIDVPHLPPANVETNKKFIFIGRFSKEKGVLTFAHAARKLNVPILLIGDGYLKDEIRNIYPQAEFTGWLSRDQLFEQMRQAKTLFFPSICYETSGLTIFEACSQGIPVVTSDTSASVDYVDHEITGLHFKTGNVNDLVEKMKKINEDSFAARLGRQAYDKFWHSSWNIETHAKKLIGIYQNILTSHDKPSLNFNIQASDTKKLSSSIPIAINGRFFTEERPTGTHRSAIGFTRELIKHQDELDIHIFCNALKIKKHPELHWLPQKMLRHAPINKKISRHLWEQFIWPFEDRNRIHLNFLNTGPFLFPTKNEIFFIHDLNFWKLRDVFNAQFRAWNRFACIEAAKKARHIACFSEYVKKDIIDILKISENRITVIPQGSGMHGKQFSSLQRLEPSPYFLCVGSLQPHKNLANALKAWSLAQLYKKGFKLIVIGKRQENFQNLNLDPALMEAPGITFTGYISDEALASYYHHATAFLYPSFHEGFGLPIIEAYEMECPVITSNTSCLPEIAGNASLLIDPTRPEEIADRMKELSENSQLRNDLISRGKERAKLFTWENAGNQLVSLIKKI